MSVFFNGCSSARNGWSRNRVATPRTQLCVQRMAELQREREGHEKNVRSEGQWQEHHLRTRTIAMQPRIRKSEAEPRVQEESRSRRIRSEPVRASQMSAGFRIPESRNSHGSRHAAPRDHPGKGRGYQWSNIRHMRRRILERKMIRKSEAGPTRESGPAPLAPHMISSRRRFPRPVSMTESWS